MKKRGEGGPRRSTISNFPVCNSENARHMRHVAPLSLWPQSIAHTSCHHVGRAYLTSVRNVPTFQRATRKTCYHSLKFVPFPRAAHTYAPRRHTSQCTHSQTDCYLSRWKRH